MEGNVKDIVFMTDEEVMEYLIEVSNESKRVDKRIVYKRAMGKFGKIFEILNTKQ